MTRRCGAGGGVAGVRGGADGILFPRSRRLLGFLALGSSRARAARGRTASAWAELAGTHCRSAVGLAVGEGRGRGHLAFVLTFTGTSTHDERR